MAERKPQTLANHRRFVAGYHIVLALILLVNLGWSGWQLYKSFSGSAVMALLLAVGLILLFYYARGFALAVQDRLIRLEGQLRMAEVLPEDLQPRISEITQNQHVGLRFASDSELPDLVRSVLAGEVVKSEAIKKKITDWRPDYDRC